MHFPTPFYWSLGIGVGVLVCLRIWNYYVRRYNDGILAASPCAACGKVLGAACIGPAREKWKEQFAAMRKEGRSSVMWVNLELICPHCGSVNMSRDVMARHKSE